ncbi:hypothetical protein AVEN_91339-1 [Araneus ventricosus]|uniref:Uncharacterized protein n=1 Tax=Araneus ventricosus TaxID=182803 RepID=A0A4Y2IY65_ARAVE|nr:hypothetical protein AVEN_91339-1 [Araneus ventricosus]
MPNSNIEKGSWTIKFYVPSGAKFAKSQGFCFEWLEPDFIADNLTNWSEALRYLQPIQEFSFNWEKGSTLRSYCVKLTPWNGNRGVSVVKKIVNKHILQTKSLRRFESQKQVRGQQRKHPFPLWKGNKRLRVLLLTFRRESVCLQTEKCGFNNWV